MSRKPVVIFFGLFCLGVVGAAEPSLEEVVISASLRPQRALDTPTSVAVLDASTLRAAGLQHLEDVLPLVPNLNWASGTSRPRYFQLRGIGENDQWQGAPNPSVGFLIDGMDFSGIGMPATLIDLGQVEVLRGPQGTTLGANALAGLINVQSRAPEPLSSLRLEANAGDHAVGSLGLVAGGALDEAGDASFRFVAQGFRGDGSRRNITLGRDDTNGYDERTLRWRSRHVLNGDWRIDLAALHIDLNNGFDAFAVDNSRVTRSDDPGRDVQRSRGLSLNAEHDYAALRFRSATAIVDAQILYSFDGDWAADPSYDFNSRFLRERRSLTQDFRWSTLDGSRFDWVTGLYAQHLTEGNDQLDLYAGEVYRALISDYLADSVAIYGNGVWHWNDVWRLGGGVRIEHRDVRYADTDGSELSPAETMAGGHLSLEYHPDARLSSYLTVARGYKAGGFNIGSLVPAARRQFAAELLHNIEIGTKFDDPIRGLRYEVAVFFMRRSEQQVSTSAQLDPGDPLSFIYLTDNAARGANYGLEGSLTARFGAHWTLTAGLGLLRTRFSEYVVGDRDLAGRGQAHAPRHQSSLSLDYRSPAGWFARADVQHVAEFFFSDSHDQRSQPYTLLNLRAGYDAGRWRVDAWMRNALNEDYAMRGFFFGNEPPDFADKLYVQLAEPRSVGVSFAWDVL